MARMSLRLARCAGSSGQDPAFRAAWRRRIEDHDCEDGWSGGIARWLHLATSLGLDAGDTEKLDSA